jgi:hypothetical protein
MRKTPEPMKYVPYTPKRQTVYAVLYWVAVVILAVTAFTISAATR